MSKVRPVSTALSTPFDNDSNGFISTTVQEAIEEIDNDPENKRFSSVNNSAPSIQRIGVYEGMIGATTASQVTFHLTSDGTASGTPLFSNLTSLTANHFQVTCLRDTDANSESPWAHIRSILNGGRSVLVQIKRSNQGGILIGGTYFGNLNNSNSVNVYLRVSGVLA
jgi:hypothetical protein